MHKLKFSVLVIILITISFLLCALSPPPDSQYDFQLSTNIPSEHKIKLINYGNGTVFYNHMQKNNGDIIICSRFSDLTLTIIPSENYEIDRIFFNNNDITSTLNSNTITLHSITQDGTLKFKFKTSSKDQKNSIKKRIINTLLERKNIIVNKTLETTDYLVNLVQTGDFKLPALYLIFIFLISPLIYIVYYLKKR